MPVSKPFRSDGYLFPPPEQCDERLLALVVEKKGDETRASMRPSEIYAFSSEIIIRDGYMVMPKIHWNDYDPGDWFVCDRVFSTDRHGHTHERELTNLHKVDKNSYNTYNIPSTRFENGYVQVLLPFVVCPDFIRNKETRNSYGNYKKLYLLHMGQGFIPRRQDVLWRRVVPGKVYMGVFEFRAKDNGAVNFGHNRNELRDHTGHIMERDAMWELVALGYFDKNGGVSEKPISEHQEMKEDLEDLHRYAQKYEEKLIAQGLYGPLPPRVPSPLLTAESSVVPPPARSPCIFGQVRQRGRRDPRPASARTPAPTRQSPVPNSSYRVPTPRSTPFSAAPAAADSRQISQPARNRFKRGTRTINRSRAPSAAAAIPQVEPFRVHAIGFPEPVRDQISRPALNGFDRAPMTTNRSRTPSAAAVPRPISRAAIPPIQPFRVAAYGIPDPVPHQISQPAPNGFNRAPMTTNQSRAPSVAAVPRPISRAATSQRARPPVTPSPRPPSSIRVLSGHGDFRAPEIPDDSVDSDMEAEEQDGDLNRTMRRNMVLNRFFNDIGNEHDDDSLPDLSDRDLTIISAEQLEARRADVIVRTIVRSADGEIVEMWVDRETKERSANVDYLNLKFDERYGAHEDPPFATTIGRLFPEDRREMILANLRVIQTPFVPRTRPLATSTPLPTPEPPVLEEPCYPIIRAEETFDAADLLDDYLIELRRDNNANPF